MADIFEILTQYRQEILKRESAQFVEMGQRWMALEAELNGQILGLLEQINLLGQDGKTPTMGQISRMERFRSLLEQVQVEVNKYQTWAEGVIGAGQQDYAALGSQAAQALLGAYAPVGVNWNRLPVGASETMSGRAGDGAPLFSVLKNRALAPEAVDGLRQALFKGVGLGWNPVKTAQAMKEGLTQGLNKALVIARTEELRAYRMAAVENYRGNSDIVKGFMWVSSRDNRTCAACWAMDGRVFGLDENLNDHPCGRCAFVPVLKTLDEIGKQFGIDLGGIEAPMDFPAGEALFRQLSEAEQKDVLGAARFEWWRNGGKFTDLATVKESADWGKTIAVTNLGDLAAGAHTKWAEPEAGMKIDFYSGKELLIGRNPDLRSYFDPENIGNTIAGSKDVALSVTQAAHIVDTHEDEIDWLQSHGDLIREAISNPKYIDTDPRKNNNDWSIAHALPIGPNGDRYLIVAIRYMKGDQTNQIITMFTPSRQIIFNKNGLKKRWQEVK